jgi:hypothetical protein
MRSILVPFFLCAACRTTTTDDDGDGGSGTFADSAACEACVEPLTGNGGTCNADIQACAADDGCRAWLDCTEICYDGDFTPACIETCNEANAGAAMLFGAVQDCVCAPCNDPCSAAC